MNLFDRAVMAIAPAAGLNRLRARAAARVMMNYDAATTGRRAASWRHSSSDADAAASQRERIAYVSRDMRRNNPFAARACAVITGNVVGDGIIPSLEGVSEVQKKRFVELAKAHLDTPAVDYYGRANLYGLQRLVMDTVVESGEALVRVHWRSVGRLHIQLQVIEPDFLDESQDSFRRAEGGGYIDKGIEYDSEGRRTAYHLFREHPGTDRPMFHTQSERVPADQIIHIYRQDRPGQMRGVSWFAPVALTLQELRGYTDAQLMRQRIAACFAAFRRSPDAEGDEVAASVPSRLAPGAIYTLGPGEDIEFGNPPTVPADSFVDNALREVASGMGITFEALTGNLGNVNFSSGRMGRLEMDRNVSAWQWLMLIPQMLEPIGAELMREMRILYPTGLRTARIAWTPPAKMIVDPTKEIPALVDKVRGGLSSWQREVRSLGFDPETIAQEQAEDAALFDRLKLTVQSDGRVGTSAAAPVDDEDDAPAGDSPDEGSEV